MKKIYILIAGQILILILFIYGLLAKNPYDEVNVPFALMLFLLVSLASALTVYSLKDSNLLERIGARVLIGAMVVNALIIVLNIIK